MPVQDQRARLEPKTSITRDILGARTPTNILFPLYSTNGVLFPYTPSLSTGYVAEYDPSTFIHSNYGYNAYVRSYPKPLSLTAEFTAQTQEEALYLLAVLHFFRSVTKSYFGVNPYNKAGTPPPVLNFSYLGEFQYNKVPVIVKDFSYTLEANIDYVAVNTSSFDASVINKQVTLPKAASGGFTWVPAHINVTLELDTQYTPIDVRNNFNLDKFREGGLLNKGYI